MRALIFVFFALLASQFGFCLFCSPYCTYSFDTISNKHVPRCTGPLSTNCDQCDTRFYDKFPIAGSCILHASSIYNATINSTLADWNKTNTNTNSYDGSTWIQLNAGALISRMSSFQPLGASTYRPVAVYGIRCRVAFALRAVSFDPIIYFRINQQFSEKVQLVPNTNQLYRDQNWIYTSPFIPFSGEDFEMFIERTDGLGNNAAKDVGIIDSYCFIAYCVQFCISCTNLHDCNDCETGYFLDEINHYCVAACPKGEYRNTTTNTCKPCDARCDECTNNSPLICTNCVDFGPFQSFLQGTDCLPICPAPKVKNHELHTCVCPTYGYATVVNVCQPCITNCLNCTSANLNVCFLCDRFYYAVVGNTSCVKTCPNGQYGLVFDELGLCYACDLTKCTWCINTSTTCTKCVFPAPYLYLSNYKCIPLCPDGYQGNNTTFQCDLCLLGTYSYQNVCYSQCPQFYVANDNIRACVLPGGYPLNLTVQVDGLDTLKFTMKLPLGLLPVNLTSLLTSWNSIISLNFISQTEHKLIFNSRRRMLQFNYNMNISNIIISNTSIVMYSTTVRPQDLIYTHSFKVRFSDNLFSPKNVIYSISAKNSTDMFPWVVRQYFEVNLKPLFLVGIFLAAIALIILLMRTKYIYRVLIQYIHCIQILGLTFYSIYPHAVQLDLYSYVMGLDFANFSFIINLTAKFIPPCLSCKSLVSFTFAIGDMNWIRLIGSLLLCFIIMIIFCALIYAFKCSRMYAPFYFKLVMDLVMIKTIHSWFSSLLFSGLNFKFNTGDYDLYILSMHMLSYFLLGPVLYSRIKAIYQNRFPNLSFFFLIIFIILISLLSLAPTLICALLIMISAVEWTITFGFNITQQQKIAQPKNDNESNSVKRDEKQQNIEQQQTPLILRYHNHLLRCMRPLTAFLIACIIMILDQLIPIILISVVLFILLILIVVDTYFLYEYYQELQKKGVKSGPKSNQIMNQTKQDLNAKIQQKQQTQYKDSNLNKDLKIFDQDDIDDDIVANKFRKNRRNNVINPYVNNHTSNDTIGKDNTLMKNFQ